MLEFKQLNKRELEGDNGREGMDEDRNKKPPELSARTDRLTKTDRLEGLLRHTVPEKTLTVL